MKERKARKIRERKDGNKKSESDDEIELKREGSSLHFVSKEKFWWLFEFIIIESGAIQAAVLRIPAKRGRDQRQGVIRTREEEGERGRSRERGGREVKIQHGVGKLVITGHFGTSERCSSGGSVFSGCT